MYCLGFSDELWVYGVDFFSNSSNKYLTVIFFIYFFKIGKKVEFERLYTDFIIGA